MTAIMSHHFLSQRYEFDFLQFIKVENGLKHDLPHAIHATHLSHKTDNHLEVSQSTLHFIAVITALHLEK